MSGGFPQALQFSFADSINRLVDWLQTNSESSTTSDVVTADLEYLGRRLDAVDGAGQKGAHAAVTKLEASRFITGTYLVLGDVLRLNVLHPSPDAEAT